MNEESLFAVAREKQDAAERAAFLAEACGGDVQLRQRVEQLLAAHGHARGILDRGADRDLPPGPRPSPDPQSPAEGPGTVIGQYKLKEQIGEGGFGLVFVAEQQRPVRRKVALKVIKPGMDTREVIARFEAERQALALMDHPNIAHVIDAGATDSGRPYFVMELVRGVAVTEYCDRSQLTTRERLDLFVSVCRAVQHAHQKGVIHRDLKPSNVLVTLHDSRPVVKVIDFGVAKALNQQLTEHSVYTRFAQMIGTPAYMSPEQAELSGLDVDTRADIYSLGVVLYELLTGTTPFETARLKSAGLDEIRRIIREEEPPRPSTRVSTLGQAATTASVNRKSDPRRLSRSLRGELDWIVMKALEKDRTRRYETATDMARDVQRYLSDEPVEASPPSTAYRLRKFWRRNRGPVLAAAVVLLALLGGGVGTTLGLLRAEHQRFRAVSAAEAERLAKIDAEQAATAERLARESAQKRLTQIETSNQILGSIFRDVDPRYEKAEGKPLRLLLGERLQEAANRLDGEAIGDPVAVARIQQMLGKSLYRLGYPAKAIPVFLKARATLAAHLGPDHPNTLSSVNNLAFAYRTAGKLELALPLARQAAIGVERHKFGLEDAGKIMRTVIDCHEQLNQFDQAETWRRKWLAAVGEKSGAESAAYAAELATFGLYLLQRKEWGDAEPILRECLAIREKKEPDDWRTFNAASLLGEALLGQGRYADAEPLLVHGYEGMNKRAAKIPANGKVRLAAAAERLVRLYGDWGKPGQAAKWQAERAKYGPPASAPEGK